MSAPAFLAPMRAPAPTSPVIDPNDWYELRVKARRKETSDIVTFDLEAAPGVALPAYGAGAHLEIKVKGELIRHYSLCSAPQDCGRYQIAVQREATGRGGSVHLCDSVVENTVLQVRGPFNHFALRSPMAHPPLLLAGGIGITPMLSMAHEMMAAGQRFELHYSGRTLERMAFVPLLRSGVFGTRVYLYADDGKGVAPMDLPHLLGAGRPGRQLYVCGPGGMIDAVERIAREQGWTANQIHHERFGAPADALPSRTGDEAFEVELASTRTRIPVLADQSVGQALVAAGVHVNLSCESGVCGSCRTRVLHGEVEHRDYVLSDEERTTEFTPCCSRARSPLLVLDL